MGQIQSLFKRNGNTPSPPVNAALTPGTITKINGNASASTPANASVKPANAATNTHPPAPGATQGGRRRSNNSRKGKKTRKAKKFNRSRKNRQ